MAENADIRLKTEINAISARLEEMTDHLEDLNMAWSKSQFYADPNSKTITLNTGPELGDDRDFDPHSIDWEELARLYEDDPALVLIFGQMAKRFRYFAFTHDPGDASSATGSVASGTRYDKWQRISLNGFSTSTDAGSISLSNPATVSYDAESGTMTVHYDEE